MARLNSCSEYLYSLERWLTYVFCGVAQLLSLCSLHACMCAEVRLNNHDAANTNAIVLPTFAKRSASASSSGEHVTIWVTSLFSYWFACQDTSSSHTDAVRPAATGTAQQLPCFLRPAHKQDCTVCASIQSIAHQGNTKAAAISAKHSKSRKRTAPPHCVVLRRGTHARSMRLRVHIASGGSFRNVCKPQASQACQGRF